jgi:short-subunit dehydrogenase
MSYFETIRHINILINIAEIMSSIPYEIYPQKTISKITKINLHAPIDFMIQVSKSMI